MAHKVVSGFDCSYAVKAPGGRERGWGGVFSLK